MDELSADALRGAAAAANLRRAYGSPPPGDLPPAFAVLLDRLDEVDRRCRPRWGWRAEAPPPGS